MVLLFYGFFNLFIKLLVYASLFIRNESFNEFIIIQEFTMILLMHFVRLFIYENV